MPVHAAFQLVGVAHGLGRRGAGLWPDGDAEPANVRVQCGSIEHTQVPAPRHSACKAVQLWAFTAWLPGCLQGDAAYLFVVSATDKQWAQSESKLRTMLKSLEA